MLASTVLLLVAWTPTTLTFVRHAETIANATGRYNSQTLNAISNKGLVQTKTLTNTLLTQNFDDILVSPSPRALKTVAPYLERTGQQAEVWPELLECCHQKGKEKTKPALPQVKLGQAIELPLAFRGLFKFRIGGERYIQAPTYADGRKQVELAKHRLLSKFSGSGKRVLLVGHSINGGKLIAMLTGGKTIKVENGKPIRLIEVKPGSFAIF